MTPRVSIVIPVFNKSLWIEETLKSVESQTFSDWECIIIDDGSTDESLETIRKYTEKSPGRWRVLTQGNSGQCIARNRGIEESSGEYVAFLDGDDTWAPNKLEIQVRILDANPDAALVICPYRIYRQGDGQDRGRVVLHLNSRRMLTNWLNLRGFGAGTESTGLVRRKFLVAIGGFDPKLSTSAGLDLTLRLEKLGDVLTAKDTYMKYRIYTGQWHANLETLSSDLESLRTKHRETDRVQGTHLTEKHDAYISLQSLRQNSSGRTLLSLGRRPRTLLYLIVLVLCILQRNLVARLRASLPGILTRIPKKYHQELFSAT